MQKEIYLLRGSDSESYSSFKDRIFEIAENALTALDPSALSLTLTEQPPPRISVIPFRRKKVAALSLYRQSPVPAGKLLAAEGFSGAYRVAEAFPVAYDRNWENGQVTPGICLLTLFLKKKNIDYDTFIDRWHNGHTPLSPRLHPLWHYNRNVVNKKLTEDSADCDGIVEEHFRKPSDLLNPMRFFGNPVTMIYHMLEVYFDTISFLDYPSIEPYLAQEYHFK